MRNNMIPFILTLTVIAIILVSGCVETQEPEKIEQTKALPYNFTLNSWTTNSDGYDVYLELNVSSNKELHFDLYASNGAEMGNDYVSLKELRKGWGIVELDLAEGCESPLPDTYTLEVSDDYYEKPFYTKDFTFKGAKIKILDASVEPSEMSGVILYDYPNINVTVENTGDVSACISTTEIKVDGEKSWSGCYIKIPISANTIASDTARCSYSDIEAGSHTLEITFRDSNNNVIATHTSTFILS